MIDKFIDENIVFILVSFIVLAMAVFMIRSCQTQEDVKNK